MRGRVRVSSVFSSAQPSRGGSSTSKATCACVADGCKQIHLRCHCESAIGGRGNLKRRFATNHYMDFSFEKPAGLM